MSRFFVGQEDIYDKEIVISAKDDIKHIKKVLRLREGDEIDVSDGIEWEYKTEISEIDDDEICLRILDKQKFAREPKLEVSLFQGVPKAGKMELIIQKCVELGIHEITPVFMDRTVVMEKGNFSKKLDRWQKISDEAVKQCKRGIIPQIGEKLDFSGMLEELRNFDVVVFPYENEDDFTIKSFLRDLAEIPKTLAIVIGPEGGFSDEEAEKMKNAGYRPVSLGKTILRTETAGMAALAMVMYELEI